MKEETSSGPVSPVFPYSTVHITVYFTAGNRGYTSQSNFVDRSTIDTIGVASVSSVTCCTLYTVVQCTLVLYTVQWTRVYGFTTPLYITIVLDNSFHNVCRLLDN